MTEIIIKVCDRFLEEAKSKGMDGKNILIRCKDCKWYYGDYCGGFGDGSFTPEDGFCHNAERKEE